MQAKPFYAITLQLVEIFHGYAHVDLIRSRINLPVIIEWSHCYEFAGLSLRLNLVDSTGEKLK